MYVLVVHNTQSAQISQKQNGRNIYVIMKTMCLPPGYYHNGFMATHALSLIKVLRLFKIFCTFYK